MSIEASPGTPQRAAAPHARAAARPAPVAILPLLFGIRDTRLPGRAGWRKPRGSNHFRRCSSRRDDKCWLNELERDGWRRARAAQPPFFDEYPADVTIADKREAIAVGHDPPMAGSESVATVGARRSALLRQRLANELVNARINCGVSLREVARRVGISVDRLKRAERGDPGVLTIDLAARIAPVVGLQLAASLHPNGDPVRDRGHLAFLQRFKARLHPGLGWRTEVLFSPCTPR